MSAEAAKPPLLSVERTSDWLNPILVKETRQALKSRQFVATFFLMLVASWIISIFGIVIAGAGIEFRAVGRGFFVAYYFVLAVAVFIIVPFGTFRSLLGERDLHTWEVLSITTLKPRQIVWGKLLSSLVQIFIYYSAITPFIAFANLLKGIDVLTIAFVLVCSIGWSLALSMTVLTASTFGSQRAWQVFLMLAVLVGLLVDLIFVYYVVFAGSIAFELPFDEPGFWWMIGIVGSFIIAFCVLFLQIAISQLTFDADNRSTGIRVAASGIFCLAIAWTSVFLGLSGAFGLPTIPAAAVDDFLEAFSVVGGIYLFVIGLFATTELDVLSRRVRRDAQRFGALRYFIAPLIPGGNRGLIYILGHLAALAGFVFLMANWRGLSSIELLYFAAAVWCYVNIYLMYGAAFGRAARSLSGDFRPAHARVLTVLAMALGSIMPQTLYFFDRIRAGDHAVYFVTDPFSTLYRLASGNNDSALVLLILSIAALTGICLNLRAMMAGMSDISAGYVPPAPSAPREVALEPAS